jgi:hypothetical protein
MDWTHWRQSCEHGDDLLEKELTVAVSQELTASERDCTPPSGHPLVASFVHPFCYDLSPCFQDNASHFKNARITASHHTVDFSVLTSPCMLQYNMLGLILRILEDGKKNEFILILNFHNRMNIDFWF